MGQEIDSKHFRPEDFQQFTRNLDEETGLLAQWFQEKRFCQQDPVIGAEVEAWLIDSLGEPLAANDRLLSHINDPQVVPELARFNIELNTPPQPCDPLALRRLHNNLETLWRNCRQHAMSLGHDLTMIGILPSLREEHLNLDTMSAQNRYAALNEQVFQQRQGRPLRLDIVGRDHLRIDCHTVMIESATTSLQVHLQIPEHQSVSYFNTAQRLSAPLVAACANSPLLFGKTLWAETRIPLFEQAVAVGGFAGAAFGPTKRVTFGNGYLRHSVMEYFQENLEHYPVLLPMQQPQAKTLLPHLRLHNGTIWRWNRPLIGFNDDGTPHIRIEHRTLPAGPSVIDAIANSALFVGLCHYHAHTTRENEMRLPFDRARDNFYRCARFGLDSQILWLDGKGHDVQRLLLKKLLPEAATGLKWLGIASEDIDRYIDVLAERIGSKQTGARWQQLFLEKYGNDMAALTRAYTQLHWSGEPVHRWEV